MEPLFAPSDFLITPGVAHLCAGGRTPALRRQAEALTQYLADRSDGPAGDGRQEAAVQRVRGLIAQGWGCAVGDIGLVSSVAEGVSMLAESLDWRPGDEVVVADIEYPSLTAPFALAPGVTLRVAEGLEDIAACVTPRTRVIAVSAVSFLNAERADLPALRALADSVGAAGGGPDPGGGLDAHRGEPGRFRLRRLLQMDAGDHRRGGGLLESGAAARLGAAQRGLVFHGVTSPARLASTRGAGA